jgi:hypothetical protein
MLENITPRQAALWWASQGYPVLPLHSINEAGACTCGKSTCENQGKHPFWPIAPNGNKNATCDATIIKGWFDEHYWLSYGVTTDDLLVVDPDADDDGLKKWAELCNEPTRPLIHTWQVRTGGGGLHVMHKNPTKIRNGSINKLIHIRGAGGYIVGVGCKHKSGGTYWWEKQQSPNEVSLADPPVWLLAVIAARTHYGTPRSPEEWRTIARTKLKEGERNEGMLRIAGHLVRNPLLDPYVIIELLVGWDLGMCEPPLGAKRVAYIVEDLFAKQQQKEAWLSCPKA